MTKWIENYLSRHIYGRVLMRAAHSYNEHGCVYFSAGLAFFAMGSLVPLTFIGLWILTVWVGSSFEAQQMLSSMLSQYLLPNTTQDIVARARSIADNGLLTLLGAWWSALVFLWSGIRFYDSLHHVMSLVWNSCVQRSFIGRKLLALGAFFVATVLFGATIATTTSLTAIDRLPGSFFGASLHPVWGLLAEAAQYFFSIVMFMLIYRFMPYPAPPWRVALGTAIPVGIAWELLKRIFTTMIVEPAVFHSVYGPLGGVVLLLIWVYCSAALGLIGAEIGAAWLKEQAASAQALRRSKRGVTSLSKIS